MLLDHNSPQERRPVGRPEVLLFDDDDMEKAFQEKARLLIERHYIKGEPNTRHDYVFGSKTMSKTAVWAIIYLHLLDNNIINDNLDRFVNIIITKFGKQYICDRTSLHKKIKSLKNLKANQNTAYAEHQRLKKEEIKAHKMFLFVVGKWKELEEK